MKIAIAIHGNLRTFLMPLRENPSIRVCDITYNNILKENKNISDIFIVTDCNDFYYNGAQYFCDDKKIEVTNNNSFRLFSKIKFKSKNECKNIISKELLSFIPNIKSLIIEDPEDYSNNEKTLLFKQEITKGKHGAIPSQIVAQYKKLKKLYNEIKIYELKNNFKYDAILKIRFDSLYPQNYSLNLINLNIDSNQIYVPGCEGNLIYDWIAYGSKKIMEPYLNLYDNLGFTLNYPSWLLENCIKCGKIGLSGNIPFNSGWKNVCPKCNTQGNVWISDITLASEYHVYKLYELIGANILNINYTPLIYRYLDLNTNLKIEDILKENELKNISLISRTEAEEKITKL